MQIKLRREWHDTDSDKVPNWLDCNIWNPNQQGAFHDFLSKVREKVPERGFLRKPFQKENTEETELTVFDPQGFGSYEETSKESEEPSKYQKVYSGMKKGYQKSKEFAKGVYEETQQFNPDKRMGSGQNYVWVLQPVRDREGHVIDAVWTDMGKAYDEETAQAIYVDLKKRGYEVHISDMPVSRARNLNLNTQLPEQRSSIAENIQQGLYIRKQPRTPVAHVMIHPGPGMQPAPQPQQGSSRLFRPKFAGEKQGGEPY
jgi:hypothetical protein